LTGVEGAPKKTRHVRALSIVERGVTAVPVIDQGHRVAGVVSESDLLAKEEHKESVTRRRLHRHRDRFSRAKAGAMTAEGLMTKPAITIRPEATIVQAARLLAQHRIKRLPVVDDENRLIGIVSRRDLLQVFVRTDEEVRDEIRHEIFARLLPAASATVSVHVDHGVVTLTGTLRQRSLIPVAVRLAAATDGVVSVINELSEAADERAQATHSGSPPRA
jgi:CBS domain-containing protein